MFLVVGQRPSGSGVVADALDSHPDLLVLGAGDLLVPLAFLLERVRDPEAARRLFGDLVVAAREFEGGIGRHLDADGVHRALAGAPVRLGALLNALYDAVATAAGVQAAGTVLPRMGMAVLTRTGLHEAGIPYLHVVRDIRTIVAAGLGGDEGPAVAARRWDTQNRMFRQRWGTDPARYRTVRYEDLRADPVRTVREVGRFLGSEIDPDTVVLPVEDPPASLDAAAKALVTTEAAEGLYDFGYDPPAGSPRRLVRAVVRRADAGYRRARRTAAAAKDRAWVLRAPAPGRPSRRDDDLAPAWCNICRWAGEAFSGVPHAESADCPRCGSIARQRFHLHGLGVEPAVGGRRVLETAPRSAGQYARAMGRWYDYTVLEPVPGPGPLGHLAAVAERPDASVDVLLSAHDLQTVPDPDAVLAEFVRVLAPGGALLLQVPVLSGASTAIEAADTAAPGTARWSFGVDVHQRVAAAGFATELLVTEELADLAAADPAGWAKAPGSGEVDVESLLTAMADASLTVVADRPVARRCGWLPSVLFVTVRGRRAAGVSS